MSQIRALRPALVIMTEARWLEVPEARPLAGVPTGHGSPWLDGLAAIFQFLRRSARRVVFISDVPTLRQPAPQCISQHRSDVRACTTPRSSAIRFPGVKDKEIALASQDHIGWIDPTSWFCAPRTCPVIVRNILVYRDSTHMVPPWAQFIAPVLGTALMKLTHPRAGAAGA